MDASNYRCAHAASCHCSTEITVTDFGSSFRASLPPCTFAETGFGTTVLGAAKVLMLSTFGAVSVSPAADFAVMPDRVASTSHALVGIEIRYGYPQLTCRVFRSDGIDAWQSDIAVGIPAGVECDGNKR